MTINEIIDARQIEEVLHFTTNNGLVGILRQGECKARALLKKDETLVHILKLNTEREFDPEWKGYVNLSISRINTDLFDYSKRVNQQFKWRILSFSPEILTHKGVQFTTTNNAYRWHLKRGEGSAALQALFDQTVEGRYAEKISRSSNMPANWTTDIQAEVLYPKGVSARHLRRIYVPTENDQDSVCGKFSTFALPLLPVEISPEKFEAAL